MNQINSKIYGLLGLSTRAGKLIFGTDAVKEAILKRKIKLVIIAEDCSEKSKQSFIQFCEKMDVEYLIFGNILGISNLVSDSGFTYECWSQGLYFIVFGIFYLVFSMLLYINIRIWSSFIDKKNKYTKWLNIIYIVIMIILFIIFILSKGQINVLAID